MQILGTCHILYSAFRMACMGWIVYINNFNRLQHVLFRSNISPTDSSDFLQKVVFYHVAPKREEENLNFDEKFIFPDCETHCTEMQVDSIRISEGVTQFSSFNKGLFFSYHHPSSSFFLFFTPALHLCSFILFPIFLFHPLHISILSFLLTLILHRRAQSFVSIQLAYFH
jgi:hypothetical protein